MGYKKIRLQIESASQLFYEGSITSDEYLQVLNKLEKSIYSEDANAVQIDFKRLMLKYSIN